MSNNRSVPNLFLIGAPKCGTSALIDQLRSHPDLFVPKVKETLFFDAHTFYDHEEDFPVKNLETYLDLFTSDSAAKASYRVDGSIFNMYSRKSLEQILELSPDARFILILRDPLSASKSMHLQRLKYAETALREHSYDFCECWATLPQRAKGKAFPPGCRNRMLFRYDLLYGYERYLDTIYQLISPEKLLIIDYARFHAEPATVHRAILNFLQVTLQKLPISAVNASYTVNPNALQRWIAYKLRQCVSYRRKFGLVKGRYIWMDKLLGGKRMPKKTAESPCDASVREFFAKSSQAMEDGIQRFGIEKYL